ncbi:LCP family protein [Paenibacillus sp. OV219]|uniref:LCP family glycopolymer transferase n=1 Tax=Paenibacillus sp. OV219 TaxID=1884377 RepID=UPI0008B3C4EF|nr:LCP family protein [Paenibacillus sp. OV219]SEO14370.1 transcriptional attenuator, LytR family [Paenibacillus sp. OV219]
MRFSYKNLLIWTSAAAASFLLIASCLVWYLYHSAERTVVRMHEDINKAKQVYVSTDTDVKTSVTSPLLVSKGKELAPFTVLMLGVDQRENDHGRSDTMIVLAVNPQKKSVLMFNIPRDTRVIIPGRAGMDKINHAYAFGDVEMSIGAVEQFLDYPIDYYIKANMEGFTRVIDMLGGVKVNNEAAFQYDGVSFAKGNLSLKGEDALKYCRMRYEDPRGDLGRNTRQRAVVQAVMHNAVSLASVTHFHALLGALGDSVKTNMTFSEMKQLVSVYKPQSERFTTTEISGKGAMIGGIWYYLVNATERSRIHNRLKSQLMQGD